MIPPPDISIVMPVYNGEKFVETAIQSILIQQARLELLVHDDGSSDRTLEILDRLAAGEPRLTVTNGANAGPAAARNICLQRAKGRFIAFLDHDDLWPSGRLTRQAAMLEEDERVGAVLGHSWVFEQLDERGEPAPSPRSRVVLTGLLQAGLFRKAALASVGGFDTSLRAADDLDLLLRLRESPWQIEIDREIAVYYRLHPDQWTADTHFSASQTVQALHRSLQRRRASSAMAPLERTTR